MNTHTKWRQQSAAATTVSSNNSSQQQRQSAAAAVSGYQQQSVAAAATGTCSSHAWVPQRCQHTPDPAPHHPTACQPACALPACLPCTHMHTPLPISTSTQAHRTALHFTAPPAPTYGPLRLQAPARPTGACKRPPGLKAPASAHPACRRLQAPACASLRAPPAPRASPCVCLRLPAPALAPAGARLCFPACTCSPARLDMCLPASASACLCLPCLRLPAPACACARLPPPTSARASPIAMHLQPALAARPTTPTRPPALSANHPPWPPCLLACPRPLASDAALPCTGCACHRPPPAPDAVRLRWPAGRAPDDNETRRHRPRRDDHVDPPRTEGGEPGIIPYSEMRGCKYRRRGNASTLLFYANGCLLRMRCLGLMDMTSTYDTSHFIPAPWPPSLGI
jgi:hypothetical protein